MRIVSAYAAFWILVFMLIVATLGCSKGYGPDYEYRVSERITKYEDKSEGIVCYVYDFKGISCVKVQRK